MEGKINNMNKLTENKLEEQEKVVYKKWQHTTWGNVIDWGTLPRISGCLVRRPKEGDELIDVLKDGTTIVFKITDVELLDDPHDMFFAKVKAIEKREMNEEEMLVFETRK